MLIIQHSDCNYVIFLIEHVDHRLLLCSCAKVGTHVHAVGLGRQHELRRLVGACSSRVDQCGAIENDSSTRLEGDAFDAPGTADPTAPPTKKIFPSITPANESRSRASGSFCAHRGVQDHVEAEVVCRKIETTL